MDRNTLNDFDPRAVSENEIYKFLTTQWQHQNQLSWSKLYVILALESGTLAGSYNIKGLLGCGLVIVGTLIGFILYRLILRDWDVRNQERLLSILDSVHSPLGLRMIPPAKSTLSNGKFLLNLLFIILLLTNLAAFAYLLPCKYEPISTATNIDQMHANPAVEGKMCDKAAQHPCLECYSC